MEFRLKELRTRLERDMEEEIVRRSEEVIRKKETIIFYLNQDIENLHQKIGVFDEEHEKRIAEINHNHALEIDLLVTTIDGHEKTINIKESKITELKDTVEEKTKTIMDSIAIIKV